MARKLEGKKVAILVADGFEQVEMTKPREALDEAGAETKIVSPKSGKIQGMNHADKGDKFDVDLTLDEARPEEFDALMIPGGLMNPDELRGTPEALQFTRHFFENGKPAAVPVVPFALFNLATARLVSLSVTLVLLAWRSASSSPDHRGPRGERDPDPRIDYRDQRGPANIGPG